MPADMRKGFDGISGLVINKPWQDQLSGNIFIFVNRTRNLVKILVWENNFPIGLPLFISKALFEVNNLTAN